MYPVHIKYPGTVVPPESPCFVIAKEGILLRRETHWMRATIPVRSIGVLDSEPVGVTLLVPAIGGDVLLQAIAFLRAAYKRYRTEAIALLYYSDEQGWRIDVPTQKVARYTIDAYDTALKIPGYVCLGSIHSHADLAASHSSVDHADEAMFDGIHITFGHCQNQNGVSVSAEVVVNGMRFPYQLENSDGLELSDELPGIFESMWGRNKKSSSFFKVTAATADFPKEWLDRINAPLVPPAVVLLPPATGPEVLLQADSVSEVASSPEEVPPPVEPVPEASSTAIGSTVKRWLGI